MKTYNLLAPGPVPVEPKSLEAFGAAPIHHRTPEFETCLASCRAKLQEVLDVNRPIYSLCSTGSGAMEAAVVNFLNPGEKVICIVSGKFGERWADMLDAFGLNCIRYDIEWGKSISVEEIEDLLKEHKNISAIYTQMCETSTGALHPIQELAAKLKAIQPDCLFCVDGITGLLTEKLNLKEGNIDVIIGGSQKAFMMPTGMSFIYLSQLAEDRMQEASLPRYYWDLRKEKKAMEKGQTFFSSPVNHYFSLEKSLEYIIELGVDRHYENIKKLGTAVRKSLRIAGLEVYTENPAPALTAVLLPESVDGKKLRSDIEKIYGVTFMGGQEDLAGKIIRIGHIGYIPKQRMEKGLEALYKSLEKQSIEIDIPTAMQCFDEYY